MKNTIIFEDDNEKTNLTLHSVVIRAPDGVDDPLKGVEGAWEQAFDKLTEAL